MNNNNIDKIDPKIAESKKQQPSATTKTTSKESKFKNSTAAAAVDNEIKQELIIVDQTEEICNKESNIEPVATATAATAIDDKEKQKDLVRKIVISISTKTRESILGILICDSICFSLVWLSFVYISKTRF